MQDFDAKWIFEARNSTDEDGISKLTSTIDGVNHLISIQEYKFLDQVFAVIPPSTASRHVLLALVRSTFPVRSRLSAWQHFVLKVKSAFDDRDLDSAKLLKGLID